MNLQIYFKSIHVHHYFTGPSIEMPDPPAVFTARPIDNIPHLGLENYNTLCVYDDVAFAGEQVCFAEKHLEIPWLDNSNDKIASMIVRNGCTLTSFIDIDYGGKARTLHSRFVAEIGD